MNMDAVVAVYADWGIGANGTQPVSLSADRRHFRELTAGKSVIVGRKTLEDFPSGKPLKGRKNIVLTRQDISITGAYVVHSPEQAVSEAGEEPCFVIGGASVYREMLPYIDRVYVTKLSITPVSDSFFPNLDKDPDWTCTDREEPLEENGVQYQFCVYERIPKA